MDFEELYGAAEPVEPAVPADAQIQGAQAPLEVKEEGDDLFLQLYGEAAPEPQAGGQAAGAERSYAIASPPPADRATCLASGPAHPAAGPSSPMPCALWLRTAGPAPDAGADQGQQPTAAAVPPAAAADADADASAAEPADADAQQQGEEEDDDDDFMITLDDNATAVEPSAHRYQYTRQAAGAGAGAPAGGAQAVGAAPGQHMDSGGDGGSSGMPGRGGPPGGGGGGGGFGSYNAIGGIPRSAIPGLGGTTGGYQPSAAATAAAAAAAAAIPGLVTSSNASGAAPGGMPAPAAAAAALAAPGLRPAFRQQQQQRPGVCAMLPQFVVPCAPAAVPPPDRGTGLLCPPSHVSPTCACLCCAVPPAAALADVPPVFPSQWQPGLPVKLPGQTRVSPPLLWPHWAGSQDACMQPVCSQGSPSPLCSLPAAARAWRHAG
jgi:hypothetical protein